MGEMVVRSHPEYLTGAVREALRDRELTPSELIQALANQANQVSDADIRVAIWYLISQNELELSADQRLRLVQSAA